MPCCEPETFWTLLHNAAHWQFELFLLVLVDGLLLGLFLPKLLQLSHRWKTMNRHINQHSCPEDEC